MKRLTKQNLDELARTMSVIPEAELNMFAGGGFTYTSYANQAALESAMNSWIKNTSYKEVTIFQFSDGTYGVYQNDANTSSYNYVPSGTIQGTNCNGSPCTPYTYTGNGKTIIAMGHTHDDNSFPSNSYFASAANTPGLPRFVYEGNGVYVTYGPNNYYSGY